MKSLSWTRSRFSAILYTLALWSTCFFLLNVGIAGYETSGAFFRPHLIVTLVVMTAIAIALYITVNLDKLVGVSIVWWLTIGAIAFELVGLPTTATLWRYALTTGIIGLLTIELVDYVFFSPKQKAEGGSK